MAITQQGIEPEGEVAGASRSGRRIWLLVVPLAVVMPLLLISVAWFGGPTVGKLVMDDLNGHTYTVTAVHLAGFVEGEPGWAPTMSFGADAVTWSVGCTDVPRPYRVVWSTLELTGPPAAPAPPCSSGGAERDVVLAAFMGAGPEVRLQDNNRVVITGPDGSLELLEQG